jgi:hypothetical protein
MKIRLKRFVGCEVSFPRYQDIGWDVMLFVTEIFVAEKPVERSRYEETESQRGAA